MSWKISRAILTLNLVLWAAAPSTGAQADTPESSVGESRSVITPGFRKRFGGSLELRPSWGTQNGVLHSDNEVVAEYQPGPRLFFSYAQDFRTSFLGTGNPDVSLSDGFLRSEFKDLVTGNNAALSYEVKVSVPTNAEERKVGHLSSWRNYVKVSYDLTNQVSLDFVEGAIVHWYTRASALRDTTDVANHLFENRLSFGPRVSLFRDKLNLKIPLILQASLHRDAGGNAKFAGAWAGSLFLSPEITYALDERTTLGLAYSQYLTAREDNAISPLDSPDDRVAQVIFQYSI